MGAFNQDEFDKFVVEQKVIGFFNQPLTLKSGRQSNWYVNWRPIVSDTFLLDKLTDFVLDFTRDLQSAGKINEEPKCFYGVPEGATKLAVLTQYKWAKSSKAFGPNSHPIPMGRAKPKEHGSPSDRYFIGAPSGPTVILEDVTTTGGSLVQTIKSLGESKIPILAAFGLTNRMERRDDGRTVAEAIGEQNNEGSEGKKIPYFQLSDATSLLPLAVKLQHPATEICRAIEDEFEKFGVTRVKLS